MFFLITAPYMMPVVRDYQSEADKMTTTSQKTALTDESQFFICKQCYCNRKYVIDDELQVIKTVINSDNGSSTYVYSEAHYDHIAELCDMIKGKRR